MDNWLILEIVHRKLVEEVQQGKIKERWNRRVKREM